MQSSVIIAHTGHQTTALIAAEGPRAENDWRNALKKVNEYPFLVQPGVKSN